MKFLNRYLLPFLLSGALVQAVHLPAQETKTETMPGSEDAIAAGNSQTDAEDRVEAEEGEPGRRGIRVKPETSPVVVIGNSYTLKPGETADEVVVIGGSATIHGTVRGDLVVVGGSATIDGEVHGDAVAVLGAVRVLDAGSVGGDAVAVGGAVEVAEGATVSGTKQGVNFGLSYETLPGWFRDWVKQCVLKLRPMAPQIGWLWALAGIFFLLYFLIAAVFPRPVQSCVEELGRRPATTFLMGLLTKLLIPIVFLILAATGLGLFVIPFVIAALFLGLLVGKAAIFEAFGHALGRPLKIGTLQQPLIAFVLGFLAVLVLYMVPVLGLLTMVLISVWGLGAVVLASFTGLRRESGRSQPALVGAGQGTVPTPMPVGRAAGPASEPANLVPPPSDLASSPSAPALAGVTAPPLIAEAITSARAGFWERMGAAFLDVVLVSIVGSWVGGPPLGFLVALAYFSGMWAWKGTTVGGIVLGIKVVRLDGRPVSFAVALVRALGAAFSVVVLFLGFLWIAWDPEKQGWHDRIAGTVVVKIPRGTSLVCV